MTPFHGTSNYYQSITVELDHFNRHFCKMTRIFSSWPFYTTFVKPPGADNLSSKICSNAKFWPYFKDTIGAIDGSHLSIAPPTYLASPYWNYKGFLSQNCLFTCNFNLHFPYALTRWNGSASDAQIFGDACSHNLHIPNGNLTTSGFPPSHPYLFHVKEFATTWQNGAMQICGE